MVAIGNLRGPSGVYVRVTQRSYTLEPGDAFGNAWARSMIGLGF